MIAVAIQNITEYAFLETGAERSIAGHQLYKLLMDTDHDFRPLSLQMTMTDGETKDANTLAITTIVRVEGRTIMTECVTAPGAMSNHTSLSVDFLHLASLISNLKEGLWRF